MMNSLKLTNLLQIENKKEKDLRTMDLGFLLATSNLNAIYYRLKLAIEEKNCIALLSAKIMAIAYLREFKKALEVCMKKLRVNDLLSEKCFTKTGPGNGITSAEAYNETMKDVNLFLEKIPEDVEHEIRNCAFHVNELQWRTVKNIKLYQKVDGIDFVELHNLYAQLQYWAANMHVDIWRALDNQFGGSWLVASTTESG